MALSSSDQKYSTIRMDSLLAVMQLKPRGPRATSLPRYSGEESASRVVQVDGRIQFLVVLGLRSLFSYKLSDGSHSQFAEAAHTPLLQPLPPSVSNPKSKPSWIWNLSDFPSFSFFKESARFKQAHLDYLPILRLNNLGLQLHL